MLENQDKATNKITHYKRRDSGSPFGIVRGFVYGYEGVKADVFMPQLRALGAGAVRLFLFWNQMQPEPDCFVWDTVDTFLAQLEPADDAWIMLGSSSTWGTKQPSMLLPPSPASDLKAYYEFVHTLVSRCKGRVRYWQMDNEPNNAIFWAKGSAQEYVEQLKVFSRAVRAADPEARIILAGAVGLYHQPSETIRPEEQAEQDFFNQLLRDGADYFDIFDVHLYDEPYLIPDVLEDVRKKMAAHGYQKPIFVGEYNGPGFFEFTENMQAIYGMQVWTNFTSAVLSDDEKVQTAQSDAEQKAMKEFYARMEQLPAQTQMFMAGCPAQWQERRHRINCRQIVMRNLLALAAGAEKTFCWNLATETSDPYRLMDLLFDKFKLMDYEDGVVKKRYPAAETYSRMAHTMAGVESVERIELPERPGTYLFEVQRGKSGSLFVVWERRDTFSGEDEAPVAFDLPWRSQQAQAFDAFGEKVATRLTDGHLQLEITSTPVFILPNKGREG
ncbi:hypothetical protein EPA93_00340 [Ktedonosporobacter rubrisoli]|uniref:Glycoside hydrolase family 42 N-terminal domain-containing protein n=1 Tax=Ktedonosporobacter rubrisoli TaxID=2509675 RepID=A0A4P6JHM5_KTERU|nr:glycoside hydrolase family 44 protein [Ktedonosporobacter rubrisoli]QBD74524.1 hypothetical protein EPA93_00340 [Ktedonosporobacter rubrisoli]